MNSKNSSFKSYLIIVLMAINIIFLTADNNIIGAVLREVEREFGVDSGDVGLISFFFTVQGAAVSIIWGYFTDKVTRKKLFALSIFVAEIPCALTYFAPNFTISFILRVLTGIGVGAAFPIVFSMLGDIFDKKRENPCCGNSHHVLGYWVAYWCSCGRIFSWCGTRLAPSIHNDSYT